MMDSILSVNMYSYENICAFSELSTITMEPPESNPIYYEDSTFEEIIQHIVSFGNLQYAKGIFLVFPLGGFFLTFQLVLFDFGLYPLVLHLVLKNQLFALMI